MIRLSPKRTSLLMKIRALLLQHKNATQENVSEWMVKNANQMNNRRLREIARSL